MAGIKESKRSLKFSVELIELLNNGDQQQRTYHIQNRSAESRKLRAAISKGSDKSFSLLIGREEKVLAAGLRLPVVLSYIPRDQANHSGAIELYCDDKLETEIAIQSYPPCASIQLTPMVVNFGDIALSHQTVTRTLSLNNSGTANGAFSLEVSTLPSYLSVSKTEGVVEAKKDIDIEVTLLCREVCSFQEQIRVSINNGTDCPKVTITGSVSLAKLELMNQPNFTPISVLSLGPMYYDSSVKKTVTLYNNSPSSTQYVTVMDATSVGHEEGVDMSGELSLACTTGGLYHDTWREQGDALTPAKMLSISPAEGIMNPYETCNIEVTFSPTFKSSERGWLHHQGVKSRRDYSLFVKFNTVGCSSTNEGGAELGVTATVVPTSIALSPAKRLKFGSCVTGLIESRDLKITNNSDTLNAVFKIQCPAHFKANPSKGTLKIGETQTTNIIFHPKQFGRLDGLLYIDIYSNSSEDIPPVHTHSLSLIGSGIVSGGLKKPDSNKKELASLTNLTHSIRPHDNRLEMITPFTKVKRHTYVDPDYALTEQETLNRTKHRGYYQQYVRDQQAKRHKTIAERKLGNAAHMNDKDIGIQPAAGICPPKLSLADLKKEEQQAGQGTVDSTTWSTQTQMEATGSELAWVESPLSKPCSVKMADECQAVLTPRELSMIEIDPSVVDIDTLIKNIKFTKQLKIKNHLNQSLLCRVKVTPPIWILPSKEGRRREWVFLLSPLSCTPVGLDILYKECGHYHQSIEVKINRDHHIQVPVRAVVSTITVTPSSSIVTLSQFPLSTHNTHLQGSLTLHNPHSVPANFSWDLKDHFDHLMVSNIDGIIPPGNSIICHFQYIHVQEGHNVSSMPIKVNVEGGESIDIVCVPEYLKSNCNFKETVLFFNPASLYLPCRRTVTCVNKGLNHAYFEVLGCHPPVQGVKVKPTRGCIAAGGRTELMFQLTATELGSFESWFKLRLKEGRTLTLRVTGSVELPRVYTDLDEFSFGNVYCGSTASIPFTLYNKGLSQVHLTFNFTSLMDFSVTLPVNSDPYKADGDLSTLTSEDGIYQLIIPANSSVKCVLHFSPKDVASYDFISPILINGQDPISPPPEQWPPSKRDPQTSVGRPLPNLKDTPKRRVMATTLVAPLVVKNTCVSFRPSVESSVLNKQVVQLCNTSSKALCWSIDTSGDTVTDPLGIKRFQDGTFKFSLESGDPFKPPAPSSTPQQGDAGYLESNETITFFVTFSPPHHGQYSATLPLYLNGDSRRPYRLLNLSADLIPERILSSPAHIAVHPVPLGVTVEAHFIVILKGFSGAVQLEASLPSQLPEGVKLSVNLPDTFEKSRDNETSVRLTCEIVFSSNVPVSITDCITFRERISGKTKKIPLTVCADNSLLSIYEFISDNVSTAQFLPDEHTGIPFLHLPSQSCVSLSKSTLTQSTTSSTVTSLTTTTPHTLSSTGSSYGGLFLSDCKGYLCRYLSLFGWPDGLRDIRYPTDLVQCVGTDFSDEHTLNVRSLGTSRGALLDMIRHLCGRLPPGVPQTPVPCKTRTDRVNRHYQEITVTLAFLRSQGALLWAVVPEALMDWRDFSHWRAASPPTTSSLLIDATMDEFKITSEQVWTHLIAQIIKVLVLPKLLSVVPRVVSNELPVTKDQVSNVYNRHELLLLTWMNGILERTRQISSNESRRPILSFDVDLMDCTVLASVISSYAPYMAEKYFDKMYSLPSTPEQVNHNALLLVEACREMNLNYDIQPTDLSAPHPIGLLLFTAYLFHSLPSYAPHSTIALEGELGSRTTQQVKIENPSSRELVYNTTVIGGETRHCFTASNTIAIPSRGSASIEIQYHAKHLHSCSAVLLLLSRAGTGRPGRTVAFTLNGCSTVAKPTVLTSVEARLYEPLIIPVPTGNMTGQFSLSLTEGPLLQEPLIAKKKRTGKIKLPSITAQNISIATDKLKSRSLDAMKLFHATLLSVDLEKGQSNVIKLEYIPLKSLQRQCCISLSNDLVGDSVILVNTTVTLPSPTPPIPSQLAPLAHVNEITRTLHLKATVGESIKEDIVIENKNQAFENAIFELGKWEIGEEERERRRDTNSLWYTCLQKAMAALELDDSLKTHWDKMAAGSDQLHFTVNTDSDLFVLPKTISVPANKHGKTVLPLEFSCDTEGRYSCTIVLRSSHDVRVYCVEVVVMDHSRMVGLEISTPALEPVTQKIPITNPTTIDWPLSVELSGRGFSGPAQFKIKALTTGYYPLTFYPRREYTSEGSLKLVNGNDDTEHCFTLKGIGERPHAQEKISIHTTAKTNIGRTLHVPNTGDRTTTYRVECDLNFVSGPPTITVSGGDVADYPIMIDPITRGQFSGAIVFIAETRSGFIRSCSPTPEYIWYHVDVEVDPALPFDRQTIKGHALDTIEHTVVVTNPFDSPTTLNVSLEGVGLSGPTELFVEPNGRSLYNLGYTPPKVGTYSGSVLFTGREDGEMTIQLELVAGNPKPVTLGTAQCELGKTVYGSLSLANELEHVVTFAYITEDSHFNVVGLEDGQIVVPARSTADVSIMFKPTELGEAHTATLTFISNEFGQQDFLMEGIGLIPSPQDPTTISSQLDGNSMAIITFTNPLSHTASFDVCLETQHNLFCLFLKQSKGVVLQSGVSLDIPVMFAPEMMKMSYTEIIVSTNEGADPLVWLYPIHGLPVKLVHSHHDDGLRIKGRAKERVERTINVPLVVLKSEFDTKLDDSLEDEEELTLREKYMFDLVPNQDGYKDNRKPLKEFIGLQLVSEQVDSSGEVKLTFSVVFLPSKPLKFEAELHIQPIGNGLWRFPVQFEALEQIPDDRIFIKAQYLTRETKKTFRLTSLSDEPTPFSASFVCPVSELSVSPSSGVLPPEGSSGVSINVTYAPRKFDKTVNGVLKIQTDSCQWSYEVIGEPVAYSSPLKNSKVDHKQASCTVKQSNRNFLRHNIKHAVSVQAAQRVK